MMIFTIRTDKPEAEIGLYDDQQQIVYETWEAHRELGKTLHVKLAAMLKEQGKTLGDIAGIVAYKGPGSFTGLRIGLSVANALAYANDCPVVGSTGDDWITKGITQLLDGKNGQMIMPEYGADVHITQPRK